LIEQITNCFVLSETTLRRIRRCYTAAWNPIVACRWGRFNPEAVAPAPGLGDDPYQLRRFVVAQATYGDACLAQLARGERLTPVAAAWVFPAGPRFVTRKGRQGADSLDGRRFVELPAHLGTRVDATLRDLPPNELSGVEAARAYLRFRAAGVPSLRAGYAAAVDALGRHIAAQPGNPRAATLKLFGPRVVPRVASSLELFTVASANGFDDELHASLFALRDVTHRVGTFHVASHEPTEV